jgi:thiol:disulfide interchange protein DsbA
MARARALLRLPAWLLLLAGLVVAGTAASQGIPVGVNLKRDDNYRVIRQQPVVTSADRIEVIDFFFYGCPYCFEMQPALERWRASAPQDIVLRRIPAVRNDSWAPLARTFFALEALGHLERLHLEVYKAYHLEELHMSKPEVMTDWVARNGIDRKQWLDMYQSEDVTRKVENARKLTKDYDIQGTPSVVVDGRLLTSSGLTDSVPLVVPVVDLLVKMVREERRKR